jgi:lysophospholipase
VIESAPFFAEMAQGPEGGRAFWLHANDGARLRLALWPEGEKGTVLLFPGRSEYIEKYGRAAAELAARGYACAAIDWRGQGLADRHESDRNLGHVEDFTKYQLDLDAVLEALRELQQPGPLYLIAHSMGGCIGLRAVLRGLDVKATVFSAPMWGIHFAPGVQMVAQALSWTARLFHQGLHYAPGTSGDTYVLNSEFAGNLLTRDPETYAWMQEQLRQHPELSLGGPSLHWLHEAIGECTDLAALASPDIPALCFLGTDEQIVDTGAIHDRMARWPKGKLELVNGARHEVMMESPAIRKQFFDLSASLFAQHR